MEPSCNPSSQPDKKGNDDDSIECQKLNWFAMEERITELVEKVSVSNILFTAKEIMSHDLIAGRGLFCKAIMKSQLASPQLSNVYASLVAIINDQFPDCGLLLVKRAVLQFKGAYDCGDTKLMQASSDFLAHLVNQTVVYELLASAVLLLLLGDPSADNIEVAVGFFIQCGSFMQDFVPDKLREILGEFRDLLDEEDVDERVQVAIEKLIAVERSKFEEYPSIIDELDLAEIEDQVTHYVSFLRDIDPETSANDFKPNSEFHGF